MSLEKIIIPKLKVTKMENYQLMNYFQKKNDTF